jgi:superoxide reductase
MKILECKGCGHVEFDQVTGKCQVCRSPESSFAENTAAIKKPADPNALTDGDKKHIPQIVVVKECGLIPGGNCTDVHTRVGGIEHVMQPKHFITWLDYYVNRKFVSRIWLSPEVCHPAAALHLNISSGLVTVVENCNVHGSWMNEVSI